MLSQVGASALLCAVAAVGAAGCGGNDSNDFRNDYNKIVRGYSGLPADIGSAVRGASAQSDEQLARQFGGLADRTSREVDEMKKLDPPGGARDEFDALVAGLGRVGNDLRGISDAAKVHSSRRAQAAARALLRDAKRLSEREDALKNAVD